MGKNKIKHVIATSDGETVEISTEKQMIKNRVFGVLNTLFDGYDKDENTRLKIKSLYRLLCTK